ncbi:MAG: hypothetical protein OEV30_06690, partial [Ignavibacteria bacterium]|nr:hypothetical protein [Ignavibacteria bacterium]
MRIQLQGVLIGVSFSLLSGSGCSLIGYGVGSAVDSSRQDTTWISGWSNWELQESDSIAISVKGESVVQGLFLRWSQLPDSVYEQRYATGSSSGTFSLPRIHDTVRVRIRPGVRKEQIYVGRFLGFTVDPYS